MAYCKIYHLPANNLLDRLKKEGTEIDMVLTDPSSSSVPEWLEKCYNILKKDGILVSSCNVLYLQEFIKRMKSLGFTYIQTISRFNDLVDGRGYHIIACKGEWKRELFKDIDYPKDEAVDGFPHAAQKPIAMIEDLIKHFTKEGDIVIDHFLGSGTTALGCKNLGRNFIGCERKEKYVKIARRRVNDTNKES